MQFLYRAYDDKNTLLYVGVTGSLQNRFRTHFTKSTWMKETDWIKVERFPDRESVLEAERLAIQNELPKANIIHNPRSPKRAQRPIRPTPTAIARQESIEEVRQLTAQLAELVRIEHDCGVSEVELARRARVTRMTIRKWLGK